MIMQNRGVSTDVNEVGVKDDTGTVVEDIDDGFANTVEAFDGFLDGSGTRGACHSEDGENGGNLRTLHAGTGTALGVPRHRRVVRSRREVTPSFLSEAS